ncbi:hypothetical protein L4X63_22670, partial [Geomonas sp. Red32]|uniref:hypothetical protein n=1 Tax=Geomonas sp. Red32 TaxID=2912856 RepID=UPI00202CFFC1
PSLPYVRMTDFMDGKAGRPTFNQWSSAQATTSIYSAYQAAKAALPAAGGEIVFDHSGNYYTASQLVIDKSITLRGNMPAGSANGTSPITILSAVAGPTVLVNGVDGWGLKHLNFAFTAGNTTGTAWKGLSAQHGDVEHVTVTNAPATPAVLYDVNTGSGAAYNSMHNFHRGVVIRLNNAVDNLEAIQQTGSTTANTCFNTWVDTTIIPTKTTHTAIHEAAADNNIFINTHIYGGIVATAVNFDYSINTSWPADTHFYGLDPGQSTFTNTGTPGASATSNVIHGLSRTNGAVPADLANLSFGATAKGLGQTYSYPGTNVNFDLLPGSDRSLNINKPVGTLAGSSNSYIKMGLIGNIDGNDPEWNGLRWYGHAATDSGVSKVAALRVYSRSNATADPTDYSFVLGADYNTSSALPLNLGLYAKSKVKIGKYSLGTFTDYVTLYDVADNSSTFTFIKSSQATFSGLNYFANSAQVRLPTAAQSSEGYLWYDTTNHTAAFSNGTANVITQAGFRAVTGNIGGGALAAGACTSGTVTVSGATTSMAVVATPVTYPGDGAMWSGYVSSANTVTVKVCVMSAMTPSTSAYNVRVLQ